MAQKYFDGQLPQDQRADPMDDALIQLAAGLRDKYEAEMERFQFQNALTEVFKLISRANKYIDETAPWILAKEETMRPRLARVLYNLLESIRIAAAFLTPFMPDTVQAICQRIGSSEIGWDTLAAFGVLPKTVTVHPGDALFPRIDLQKELEELEAMQTSQPAAPSLELEPYTQEPVDFDTFCRSDFRAVKVKDCQPVKKSEKLLCFTLDDGSGTDRQILSGIAKWYRPEDLVGKTLMAILNLPPRKMMRRESCGMLISAVHKKDGEEVLNLIMLDDRIPAGAKMC